MATRIFLVFAFAYFFSALLRAVTATLAPVFAAEIRLDSSDLGLLAGAYFLGFSAMQLPLGAALDRYGPRRSLLLLLGLAVLGCVAFASATGLPTLFASRVLIGVGVSACLMAPLTCFRQIYSPEAQMRANSWMLMTGSLGMLASTLPVQWLLPSWGWRGLFWALSACLLVAVAAIAVWAPDSRPDRSSTAKPMATGGYREIFSHPMFVRSIPLGLVMYGGMVAVQALWAGPWLTRVAGQSAQEAAQGLFIVNACMLTAFALWGLLLPRLTKLGLTAHRLMAGGLPLSLVLLAWIVWREEPAGAWHWAAWCVACTFVTPSQPAIGQAFPAHLAGRALSAFNLLIFVGVFAIQWGVGLVVDYALQSGSTTGQAFRSAFTVFWLLSLASYLWYLRTPRP